jgi:two-component system sensor histidine kinase UhpB
MLAVPSLFRRWIAAVLLPVAVLAGVPAAAQTLHLRSAQSVAGDAAGPPAAGAPSALEVALPDEWSRSRPGFEGVVWYRVQFERPAVPVDGSLLALAIERVCSSFEVYLNGGLIHGGGRMAPPLTNNCHHPQLVDLPTALLRPGTNTIDVKVAGRRREEVGSRWRAGGLSALAVAPHAEVESWHARRTAAAVGVPMGASATLMLLGGFMFALGFVHRRQSQLAYFGALAVACALLDARLWLRVPFLDHHAYELLVLVLLGVVAWASVQFLLRTAGLRSQLADLGLPVQCAAIVLAFVLAGPERTSLVAQFWHVVLVLEIAVAVGVHLRHGRQARDGTSRAILLLVGAAALSAGLQLAGQWIALPAMAALGAPLLLPGALVVVGLRLAQQLGRALQSAELTRQQLEQRIRDTTGEVERNLRQMVETKVEQVTERERKRIAADLHDDLGAKLLTIVHTSGDERISALAREALEEMRLSVRGLTGRRMGLTDALGDWRAETVSRLAQAGIEGDWQAPDETTHELSARAYVQTTRILREATNNIIKHSNATRCTIRCGIADGDFQLVIEDNGDGIAPEVEGRLDRGHGLASMKNRAKQLQGQCLVESGPGYGTVIRLTLPLDRAAPAS